MNIWEYTNHTCAPGESWYDLLREKGTLGWEAWHMEKTESGFRTLYFKRPKGHTVVTVTEVDKCI